VFVIKFPDISPVTGVVGVAASTVISQIIGLFLNIYYVKRYRIEFIKPSSFKDFWYYIKKIIGIGFPAGISGSTFTLSQVITTSFIALIGTYALSAKVYYDNILCYAYLFSMSFGSANSLLVGRLVGAGNYERAKELNFSLVKLTIVINLIISLLIVAFRVPLVRIFTNNQNIIDIALGVFLIDIIAESSRAVSQIYEYALRSAGDMKFMLIVVMCSCWIISVGLSYLLSIVCGLGIIGCYISIALDESIRAVASVYRWRKGKWSKGVC
jgi:Na+-driven multidrug efflux pump